MLEASFTVTSYVAPLGQGLTAGATPTAPAPAFRPRPRPRRPARRGNAMKPWRMQKFFGDLVYDLREAADLLPIVIALAVASSWPSRY